MNKTTITVGASILIASFLIVFYKGVGDNLENQTAQQNIIDKGRDTSNRLESYEKFSSNWGMTPFGNEGPINDDTLEWNARTVSGVTYTFGKGNPKETSIKDEDMNDFWKNGGETYMYPAAEYAMLDFIDKYQDGIYIFNKCTDVLDRGQYDKTISWRQFPKSLSINDILYIDAQTGRKEFHMNKLEGIRDMLGQLEQTSWVNGHEQMQLWQECISADEYTSILEPIRKDYHSIISNYLSQSYHQ